jgi:hypothetical protein
MRNLALKQCDPYMVTPVGIRVKTVMLTMPHSQVMKYKYQKKSV